jgi:cytosine permease
MGINDYARQSVPRDKTVSAWYITLVFAGVALTIPAFLVASKISLSLGLLKGLASTLIAGFILFLVASFTAWIGGRTRLSTYFISKITFGRKGALLINLLIAVTMLGWFAVTLNIFAKTLNSIAPISEIAWCIIGGLLMTATAVWGFKALGKLSKFVVPVVLMSLFYLIGFGIYKNGFNIFSFVGNGEISFSEAISMQVGAWILGACVMPDITRYVKSSAEGTYSSFLIFLPVFSVLMLLFMIPSILFNSSDFVQLILLAMPSFIVVPLIILISWSTNDNNLYSTGLSMASLFPMSRKVGVTIFAGLVGTALAMFGVLNHFQSFLMLLGVLITPVAGTYVGDYTSRSRSHLYHINSESRINFRKRAFTAWICGAILAFVTSSVTTGGLELFTLTTVPALDGFILSFILIKILNKKN